MNATKSLYAGMVFLLILLHCSVFTGCQDSKSEGDNCNERQTAKLTVKNGLPHAIWVDARILINTNFDKRYLLPGESHVYTVDTGNINLVTSFIPDDHSFKTVQNYRLATCYEVVNEIKRVCSIFNNIERITIENSTSKPIVTDILYWGRYWAGEETLQPNERFSYYMVKSGFITIYYRYTDTEYWNCSESKYFMFCDTVTYRCIPYEVKDIQPGVKQEFTPLGNSIFPE